MKYQKILYGIMLFSSVSTIIFSAGTKVLANAISCQHTTVEASTSTSSIKKSLGSSLPIQSSSESVTPASVFTTDGWVEDTQTPGIIKLTGYIGHAKDVVIPTAKDLGKENERVLISSQGLTQAGTEADSQQGTLATSTNGSPISVFSDSMTGTFQNLSHLTKVDLSNLDTSNVKNMSKMFYGCSGLTNLNLTNLNTKNVTDTSWMFAGLNIQIIDLRSLDLSNATNLFEMFNSKTTKPLLISVTDSKLKQYNYNNDNRIVFSGTLDIDGSKGHYSDGTTSKPLFSTCAIDQPIDPKLVTHQVSQILSDVKTSQHVYEVDGYTPAGEYQTLEEQLNGTYNVKWKSDWLFKNDQGTIVITGYTGHEKDIKVPTAEDLGYSGEKESRIDSTTMHMIAKEANDQGGTISFSANGHPLSLKTDPNTEGMFKGLNRLVSIDFSNCEIIGVGSQINFKSMFEGCNGLISVNLPFSSLSEPVISWASMFKDCISLRKIDMRGWKSSNSSDIDLSSMFENCHSLNKIESNDDTDLDSTAADKANYDYMFKGCDQLTIIPLKLSIIGGDSSKEMFKTAIKTPLMVEDYDKSLINYNFEADNRIPFSGKIVTDKSKGSFSDGSTSRSLFSKCCVSYEMEDKLVDDVISEQMKDLKGVGNYIPDGYIPASNYTTLSDQLNGTYNVNWRERKQVAVKDPNLQAAMNLEMNIEKINGITDRKNTDKIWEDEIGQVTSLSVENKKISDITGLEKMSNLSELNLSQNEVKDLKPLENLVKLKNVWLSNNKIFDISPLLSLSNLEKLSLDNNDICQLPDFAKVSKNLSNIDLSGNHITNFSQLGSLQALKTFYGENQKISENNQQTKLNGTITTVPIIDIKGEAHYDINRISSTPDGLKLASDKKSLIISWKEPISAEYNYINTVADSHISVIVSGKLSYVPNGLSDPDSQMGKTADYYVTIPSTVQLKPTKKADSINVRIIDGNDVKQTYAGNKKVQVLVQSSNDYQLIDSKDVNKKMAYVVQFEGKTLDSHNSVAGMLSNKSTELSGTAAIDGQDKVGDFSDILTFTIENK